jgi:hypothetical protein
MVPNKEFAEVVNIVNAPFEYAFASTCVVDANQQCAALARAFRVLESVALGRAVAKLLRSRRRGMDVPG